MALHRASACFGSALAFNLMSERSIFAGPDRTSYLHLEMSLDRLGDIDYCDYMNKAPQIMTPLNEMIIHKI